jgi:hypothetical protein
MSTAITLSLAAIKIADRVKDELERELRTVIRDGYRGYLDVTVDAYSTGGRIAVILEAIIRPEGSAEPIAKPGVMRFDLRDSRHG